MEAPKNPFTPGSGRTPACFAGRRQILADMRYAFRNGLGDPCLCTLLSGARGMGKTALLSSIADEAADEGWIAVTVAAGTDMLENILQKTAEAQGLHLASQGDSEEAGMSRVMAEVRMYDAACQPNWRSRMNAVFAELGKTDTGLLIAVDDVKAGYEGMVRLVSTYQLFIREGKLVSLVMAGLPGEMAGLLENDSISFLWRSHQCRLERIDDREIEAAFKRTIQDAGKSIGEKALERCVASIQGYPYMMQLVGYRSWEASGSSPVIDEDAVDKGIARAQRDLTDGVLSTTYRELSPGDRRFLFAMLQDDGPSRGSEIAKRLGKRTNYVSTYKRRLLKQGLIEELPDRTFQICIPFLREYLAEIRE